MLRPVIVIFVILSVSQVGLLVENNPTRGYKDVGGASVDTVDTSQIVDTGFVLTTRLHVFFTNNQFWVDVGALLNTLLVAGCQIYAAYMSFWVGDHGLMFRILFAASLRSFCGWFTYLPASTEYLPSHYDFPDVMTSGALESMLFSFSFPLTPAGGVSGTVPPFVSFFSGHVANAVMVANFTYLRRNNKLAGKILHVLNALQVIRLLATRGHYSIDIIVGWIVAVYVSNPAERLGTYFSRATSEDMQQWAWEKDWVADLMYMEVNGKKNEWDVKKGEEPTAPLKDFAQRARHQAVERMTMFKTMRLLQLQDFQKAVAERGLKMPNWLNSSRFE